MHDLHIYQQVTRPHLVRLIIEYNQVSVADVES